MVKALCGVQGNIIPISAVLTPPSAAMTPAKNPEADPSAPIGAATPVSNVTVNHFSRHLPECSGRELQVETYF